MNNRSANESDQRSLQRLADRAKNHSFFLGSLLADYQRRSEIDDAGLAGRLNCAVEALPRLFLCRCPAPEDEQFIDHIDRIAGYVPCDGDQLLRLIREAQTLDALTSPPCDTRDAPTPFFLAARDRPPKDDRPPKKQHE